MSYYKHHIFFCLNERENGEDRCAHDGAQAGFDHCKSRVKAARPGRPGRRARQQGRLPRPLRRRPGGGRLPRRDLVHLRRRDRHRRDRRFAPEAAARSSSACCCRPTSAAEPARRRDEHPHHARARSPGRRAPIECAIDTPAGARRAASPSICHPHPLHGGTMDNKVVQTLARAFVAARLARRCASTSAASARRRAPGTKAAARSTTRSPSIAARAARSPACRWCSAGFSFGGYVAARGRAPARRRARPSRASCWSAPSTEKQPVAAVPADTLVIHGESRRRRAARGHARLGAAAGAAGHRLARRRPFLPRPARAAENVVVRELRDLAAV